MKDREVRGTENISVRNKVKKKKRKERDQTEKVKSG